MKKYKVIIRFTDGDEINCNVVAESQAEALQRVVSEEKAIEFISEGNKVVDNVDIAYIGEYEEITDDPSRFSVEPSQEREGWYVAVDKKNNVVILFEKCNFNNTIDCKPLDDAPALDLATAMRELVDWLRKYHSELLDSNEDLLRQANRKRIGSLIADERKRHGLSIRELADMCGVTFQNITKIENGKYNVSIDILRKICDALGVEITFTKK